MMDLYQHCLLQVVNSDKKRIMLSPLKFKGNAVRVANYLRNWGYKCRVWSVLGFCHWVEVIIQ